MYKPNAKSCIVSGCSISCLSLLLVILLILFLLSKFDVFDNGFLYKSTQKSHLILKDKPIVATVGLISDSESDWDYLEIALTELKNRGVTDVFHLGDISHLGVSEDLLAAKGYFEKSGLKVHPIPGDRDLWKSKGIEAFSDVFGVPYGVVDVSGIKFLLINNSDEYEGIDDEQWKYISENMSSSKFVLLHNPIYFGDRSLWRKGMGEYSTFVDNQRKKLLDLVRSSNSVSAVFGGDQHLFSENRDKARDILFHYIVGATNSDRNLERPNMAILTVYEDGDYYVQKVSF